MLLSELEMSGPRENSVGARTWASQVGSLDNVDHVIFRHRNLNKHLRFHIIRADGLGCGRGQRGVLKKGLRGRGAYSKKNLRGRGAYPKKTWTSKETLSTQKPAQNATIGYQKKMSTPQVPTTTNLWVSRKKLNIPWSIPGQHPWDISRPSPHEAVCLFRTISPSHVCTHALGCVFLKRQNEATHYPMWKKTNACQKLHHTVKS